MMIELKDLSYGYTRKTVLEGLNVRFEEGGMYAVMGAWWRDCWCLTGVRCLWEGAGWTAIRLASWRSAWLL